MDILEIVMLNEVCRTISIKTTVSYHNAHCGPTNLPFLQSALISHTSANTTSDCIVLASFDLSSCDVYPHCNDIKKQEVLNTDNSILAHTSDTLPFTLSWKPITMATTHEACV